MWADFEERQQEMDFFNGGNIIMDSYFEQKQIFKVKMS